NLLCGNAVATASIASAIRKPTPIVSPAPDLAQADRLGMYWEPDADWMTRPLTPVFSACCRPTYARWLNDLSFRPPMSVTRQAENWAFDAADAALPRRAAKSDASSSATTARAVSVSARFLTWMVPPLELAGGLAGGSLAPFSDAEQGFGVSRGSAWRSARA